MLQHWNTNILLRNIRKVFNVPLVLKYPNYSLTSISYFYWIISCSTRNFSLESPCTAKVLICLSSKPTHVISVWNVKCWRLWRNILEIWYSAAKHLQVNGVIACILNVTLLLKVKWWQTDITYHCQKWQLSEKRTSFPVAVFRQHSLNITAQRGEIVCRGGGDGGKRKRIRG